MIVAATLGTNPVMIYAGQELGEKGMDSEGYSGMDGRTTIFDWWSISSIKRLRQVIQTGEYKTLDTGKLVKAGMKKEVAEVFCKFAAALRFAATDEAIRQGTTYDLCYCNMGSDGFDKNRHYAFLRDYEDHTLLIAANFSAHDAVMKLTIPEHAFEWMEIPVTEDLYPGKMIEVDIAAYDAIRVMLC